ncbi:hypothetical protein [Allomuricauda sp. d1]|uniref:hypothetical protein n=1 Tax=Allomuricauda sp. d1 TaxID=3136725 RepID=UPI0031DE20F7
MKSSPYSLMALVLLVFIGCKSDDIDSVILQSTEYRLNAVNGSGITGTATFTQDSNGSTEVLIQLDDGSSTAIHPAFIRFNNANEGGAVALTLEACECAVSRTAVTELDTGTAISYDDLLTLDGHISIHESPTDMTVISVADIGANAN